MCTPCARPGPGRAHAAGGASRRPPVAWASGARVGSDSLPEPASARSGPPPAVAAVSPGPFLLLGHGAALGTQGEGEGAPALVPPLTTSLGLRLRTAAARHAVLPKVAEPTPIARPGPTATHATPAVAAVPLPGGRSVGAGGVGHESGHESWLARPTTPPPGSGPGARPCTPPLAPLPALSLSPPDARLRHCADPRALVQAVHARPVAVGKNNGVPAQGEGAQAGPAGAAPHAAGHAFACARCHRGAAWAGREGRQVGLGGDVRWRGQAAGKLESPFGARRACGVGRRLGQRVWGRQAQGGRQDDCGQPVAGAGGGNPGQAMAAIRDSTCRWPVGGLPGAGAWSSRSGGPTLVAHTRSCRASGRHGHCPRQAGPADQRPGGRPRRAPHGARQVARGGTELWSVSNARPHPGPGVCGGARL